MSGNSLTETLNNGNTTLDTLPHLSVQPSENLKVKKIQRLDISKEYSYHFDYPEVLENGSVTFSNKHITLYLPEKKFHFESFLTAQDYRHFSLFINQHLKLDSYWFPIYTIVDYYKIKEMLILCYTEFSKQCDLQNFMGECKSEYSPSYFDSLHTSHFFHRGEVKNLFDNTQFKFEINYESNPSTTIQLTANIKFQIFIGKNLTFCNERDFKNTYFSGSTIQFITALILHKLVLSFK